jgi:hypothetical protein
MNDAPDDGVRVHARAGGHLTPAEVEERHDWQGSPVDAASARSACRSATGRWCSGSPPLRRSYVEEEELTKLRESIVEHATVGRTPRWKRARECPSSASDAFSPVTSAKQM